MLLCAINEFVTFRVLLFYFARAMALATFARALAVMAFCRAFAIGTNACAKGCGDQSIDAMLTFACAATMTFEQSHIRIDTRTCATSTAMVASYIIRFGLGCRSLSIIACRSRMVVVVLLYHSAGIDRSIDMGNAIAYGSKCVYPGLLALLACLFSSDALLAQLFLTLAFFLLLLRLNLLPLVRINCIEVFIGGL